MNEAIERKIEKFSRNSTMIKKNKSNGAGDSNLLAALTQSNTLKEQKKRNLNKTFIVDRNNFVKGDFISDEQQPIYQQTLPKNQRAF